MKRTVTDKWQDNCLGMIIFRDFAPTALKSSSYYRTHRLTQSCSNEYRCTKHNSCCTLIAKQQVPGSGNVWSIMRHHMTETEQREKVSVRKNEMRTSQIVGNKQGIAAVKVNGKLEVTCL